MKGPGLASANAANNTPDSLGSSKVTQFLRTRDCDIQDAFHHSRSQWIDDPVICQWRDPTHHIHRVLSDTNDLYHEWKLMKRRLFSISTCPIWKDTGRALAKVGLPWHSNQVNMPDQIDSSWPFHFKDFETQLLQLLGSRVGNSSAVGYVSSHLEASCYCIRALQQELRRICPNQRPVLVYDQFDHKLIDAIQRILGLDTVRVHLSDPREEMIQRLLNATANRARPMIFVASVGNSATENDNISIIADISTEFPLILHVDAFRSFDYITTMSEHERRRAGVEKFVLANKSSNDFPRTEDGFVIANSIVAGGLNQPHHGPAVSLTPNYQGVKGEKVAYIRSFDTTLGGSRDAIAPLWLALYELRLGNSGIQRLCRDLLNIRSSVLRVLKSQGMTAYSSTYSLDVVVISFSSSQKQRLLKLGGTLVNSGEIVLAIQTQFLTGEVFTSSPSFSESLPNNLQTLLNQYPIDPSILQKLKTTVQGWKTITRSTAGYPLHMGSLAALGPVIARFWDLDIPQHWVENMAHNILTSRLASFGVPDVGNQCTFKAAFTNGSTMGNRCGIHTAFSQFPDATIYLSTETHYSVMKTLRDCDKISNVWSLKEPQFSQIPSDSQGRMCADALLKQIVLDKQRYTAEGREYHLILFVNIGTTFAGARDDLSEIYQALKGHGIEISYIHADGAFDFGFDTCGIRLGKPGSVDDNGMPCVQGVTISHHKALGQNVSGEVLCFTPERGIAGTVPNLDARVVFETWLYNQVYMPRDRLQLRNYCKQNASFLEKGLRNLGLATKRNPDSMIVVFERPVAWITEEFSLRPEGDWVHFITMPHISPETIDLFLERIKNVDEACRVAFSSIAPLLTDLLGRGIQLRRLQNQSKSTETLRRLSKLLKPVQSGYHAELEELIKRSVRGALSVAAVDDEGNFQLVFLVESNRTQSIVVNPLLLRASFMNKLQAIQDIQDQLMGLMGRYLKAKIRPSGVGHQVYVY
ncbi:unnamed protein product [Clonostachys rosea f. rosea IK726]|uniref:Uncharacterized protein n=1 Tax=Clonostachys rosea f. rosea IK726 TaxID=1349383 RepID=A0ACA9TVG4_BIOOC|nr:unnamed protein product [Clonostachys rosea f. rosea IK726]